MIKNKVDWCVNRYLQSNQFTGRRVEEKEKEKKKKKKMEKIAVWPISVYSYC